MVTTRLRKTGNSFAVTIPREELERLNIREGDMVGIEVRKVTMVLEMAPDIREAFDVVVKEYKDGIDYLSDK